MSNNCADIAQPPTNAESFALCFGHHKLPRRFFQASKSISGKFSILSGVFRLVALKFLLLSCKIRLSLSDPKAVVPGKGVIAVKKPRKRVKKRVKKLVKRIVEGVIVRAIYDWFKSFFQDND